MDPISFAVTLLALYALLKRVPGLVAEALAEQEAAKRGQTTAEANGAVKRLDQLGLEPATGGPLRRVFGNAWREFLGRRAAKGQQDGGPAGDEGWWARRTGEAADRWTGRWRTDPKPGAGRATLTDPVVGDDNRSPDGRFGGDQTASPTPDQPDGGGDPSSDHPEDPPTETVHGDDSSTYRPWTPPTGPQPWTSADEPGERRPPIRVDATVGSPLRDPVHAPAGVATIPKPAIEGAPMANTVAVPGGAVTGVVSGAAEARNIARQLQMATDAYVSVLAAIRGRIHALGEQTLGTVQMATYSRVVNRTLQVAEAAAAAQAAARRCTGEVQPLLGEVAREFDRLNS